MKWGQTGSGEEDMKEPGGIVIDSEGYLYVGDADNNRVLKFKLAK